MKFLTKFAAYFTLVIAVLIISRCVPTGSVPSGTFTVNISDNAIMPNTRDTTILIDGDSISFSIMGIQFFTVSDYVVIATRDSSFQLLSVEKYWYDYLNQVDDSINATPAKLEVNTFSGGLLVNNAYTANTWKNFTPYGNEYLGYALLFKTTDAAAYIFNGVHHNTDEYIVLRKKKNASFQYYWIRVRVDENPLNSGSFLLKILNGRYQLNSITTGQ